MSMIQDSGERREFSGGAVRDMAAGKGRCDLLPLRVAADCFEDGSVIRMISAFMTSGNAAYLHTALAAFMEERSWDTETMLLETARQMEDGAAKYGERNWERGIPTHSYVDSALRHYLKWRRGDGDERHDRAFCWNVLCLIWTVEYKPEMDDIPREADR